MNISGDMVDVAPMPPSKHNVSQAVYNAPALERKDQHLYLQICRQSLPDIRKDPLHAVLARERPALEHDDPARSVRPIQGRPGGGHLVILRKTVMR